MQLGHLIYISELVPLPRGARLGVKVYLDDIRIASGRNNPPLGLTGMLLYSAGNFIQVLEGPLDSLREMYSRIFQDKRHENVLRLAFYPVETRSFERWYMGILNLDEHQPLDREAFLRLRDQVRTAGDHAPENQMVLELLNHFREALVLAENAA